jgi:hypothetical protein
MQLDSIPSQYRAIFTSMMNNARAGVRTFLDLGVPPGLTLEVVKSMYSRSIRTAKLEAPDEEMLLKLGTEMLCEAAAIETAEELRRS